MLNRPTVRSRGLSSVPDSQRRGTRRVSQKYPQLADRIEPVRSPQYRAGDSPAEDAYEGISQGQSRAAALLRASKSQNFRRFAETKSRPALNACRVSCANVIGGLGRRTAGCHRSGPACCERQLTILDVRRVLRGQNGHRQATSGKANAAGLFGHSASSAISKKLENRFSRPVTEPRFTFAMSPTFVSGSRSPTVWYAALANQASQSTVSVRRVPTCSTSWTA